MSVDQSDEKKPRFSDTIALLDADKTLFFHQHYNEYLFKALKGAGITDVIPFTSFDSTNIYGELFFSSMVDEKSLTRNDLLIKFSEEKINCHDKDFITNYDPYLMPGSQSSWKEYYEPIYEAHKEGKKTLAVELLCLARARDFYYKIFERIRQVQIGSMRIEQFGTSDYKLYNKECESSVKELTKLLESQNLSQLNKKTINFWITKLNDLEILLNKKEFFSVEELKSHFEKLYATEFDAVKIWGNLPDYKNAQLGDKGDMLGFTLHKLKGKANNIVLFDDKSEVVETAATLHPILQSNNRELPHLIVYQVNDLYKGLDQVGHDLRYVDSSIMCRLHYDLLSQFTLQKAEAIVNSNPYVDNTHGVESEASCWRSNLKLGPCFFYPLAVGTFSTATIATVSSLLTQEQNEKLFQLLPDNIRESTISTLTAACQNVKNNYATFIAAAVIFLIILATVVYYNRPAIKKRLSIGGEGFQPLEGKQLDSSV